MWNIFLKIFDFFQFFKNWYLDNGATSEGFEKVE